MDRDTAEMITSVCLDVLAYKRIPEKTVIDLAKKGKGRNLGTLGEEHKFKFANPPAADAFMGVLSTLFGKKVGRRIGSLLVTVPDFLMTRPTLQPQFASLKRG